jgi:hypothetical protein
LGARNNSIRPHRGSEVGDAAGEAGRRSHVAEDKKPEREKDNWDMPSTMSMGTFSADGVFGAPATSSAKLEMPVSTLKHRTFSSLLPLLKASWV